MRRRSTATAAALPALLLWLAVAAGPVAAADPVTFGTPTADSTYGQLVEFDQPVDLGEVPSRVELLLTTPSSVGPGVLEIDPPTRTGDQTLHFALELADGHIVPNTRFTARWRVTDADGTAWVGPEISETYSDTRVDWRTLEGDVVRVHWYEGGDEFGRRALEIGDEAVAEVSQLLGVTEEEPIDFFIYADQGQFYDALGPSTRENVGGEAHADIRTLFALITPGQINDDWVQIVVPHELTHLVFDTATDNPYHDPPHWLNEGLAVYLSEGYSASDRSSVEAAARDGTLMPLEGLVGAFPTTQDRFFLAYSESVSAVDDIVADHSRDALIGLIRSYADGVSDDEAFTAALGMDVAAFEQSWLEGLGASTPVRHGPQPAPVGPLPEGWSGAAPNATVQPGATAASTGGTNAPLPAAGSNGPEPAAIAVIVIGGTAIAVVLLVLIRRSRRRVAASTTANATVPAGWTLSEPTAEENATFSLPADPEPAPESSGSPPPAPPPPPTKSQP